MRAAKIVQIGNSRGIRIPKALLLKYDFKEEVVLKEHPEGVLIKARKTPKLSWEDTYKDMADSKEDWSEWEALNGCMVKLANASDFNLCGSNSPRLCLEKINIYANEPSAKFARFRSIPRPLCGGVVY